MSHADPYKQVPFCDLGPSGDAVLAGLLDFPGGLPERARWQMDLVREASRDPILRAVSRQFGSLRALHDFRKYFVRYKWEGDEEFETPRLTLARRFGDCEDAANLGAALAMACECVPRLVFMGRSRELPGHCSLVVTDSLDAPELGPDPIWIDVDEWHELPAGWSWSETTVDARFGEHPYLAAERLGVLEHRTELTR